MAWSVVLNATGRTVNQASSLASLGALGLVESASAQVRRYHSAPVFKLFILNQSEAFFGFYPVVRHPVVIPGSTQPVEIFDPMGKDATLFHYAKSDSDDDPSISSQYVDQVQTWFNSFWTSVAKEYIH